MQRPLKITRRDTVRILSLLKTKFWDRKLALFEKNKKLDFLGVIWQGRGADFGNLESYLDAICVSPVILVLVDCNVSATTTTALLG